MSDTSPQPPQQPEEKRDEHPPVIAAQELFRGTREVWIEHDGVCYRLRLTRRNKLILQK